MKRAATALSFFLCSALLSAQGINQSVEVNNEYESTMDNLSRPSATVSVPDSLLSFDYNFDYSVFDSPFKGSYEFTPYTIQITPEASRYDGKKFYLRAGAGWLLHPEFQLAWIPSSSEKSVMNVYARGGGYSQSDGYDLSGTAGVEKLWMMKRSTIKAGVEYNGIFTEDSRMVIGYHNLLASIGLKSLSPSAVITYDVKFRYRLGYEDYEGGTNHSENLFSTAGNIGFRLASKHRLLVDFDLRKSFNSGLRDASPFFISATPKLSFTLGKAKLSAGARFDLADNFVWTPAVEFSVPVFRGSATFNAGIGGGKHPFSIYQYKEANHRFNMYWMWDTMKGFSYLQRDFEAHVGLRGHISDKFDYSLRAGYAFLEDNPTEAIASFDSGKRLCYLFNDYQYLTAGTTLIWKSDRVKAEGSFDFGTRAGTNVFHGYAPAQLKGKLSFSFRWAQKLWTGVTLDASSGREALNMEDETDLPSWFDLGINAEYRISSRWGAWIKGGNILGQKVQKIPGYVEKGPWITAGISLSL